MKKILCGMIAACMLICPAPAEGSPEVIADPTISIQLVSPTPTAQPVGETFSSEDLIVTLPAGLRILSREELSGYEAAVQDDFPGAGQTLLAAANDDFSAVLTFAAADIATDGASAANEAAERILGSSTGVVQSQHGENSYAAFACAIEEDVYRLYCLGNETRLLIIGAVGLEEAQLSGMLAGLVF